jgi:hypothetical protein
LDIQVENTGTRPASNVDVKLRFPHTVEIYKKNQLDAVFPTAPTPPERPLTPEEEEARNLCKILNRDFAPPPETDNAPVLPRQAVSVSFLEYHFDKVKHGNPQPLEPLHVLFGSFDDAGSFKIECEISADEQPKKSTGTVSVVVKKE